MSCTVPTGKLLTTVPAGTTPVVIVACGSFSPPTLLHLRILEDAKDALKDQGLTPVRMKAPAVLTTSQIGGFLSPVHGKYGKASLAPMDHRLLCPLLSVLISYRVEMARLAVSTSDWLQVRLNLANLVPTGA